MDARVVPAGDAAYTIQLPERIDPAVNDRAIAIAAEIRRLPLPVTDIVIGYRTVTVFVDPLAMDGPSIADALIRAAAGASDSALATHRHVEVPVCYDGDFGPDLDDVAVFAGCTTEEVIARHLAVQYRVYVVGFVPGFAYMAHVDSSIAAPRRSSPRLRVAAGSVAIAAGQTGIYPVETPGGWNVIGRCPVRPYDAQRGDPFLFRPGDQVTFRRIGTDEFHATSEWGGA